MSQYAELDKLIVSSIRQGCFAFQNRACWVEARRIAEKTGRDDFRVIDGRLQALRKAGVIVHRTKAEANGLGGWHLVQQPTGNAT